MRELGYVEGKNIIIDYRNTEGKTDRFSGAAAELVRLKVNIIVAAGGSAVVLAAKPATDTIPIVMTNPGHPVAIGVVASLARPGGNVTGLTSFSTDLRGKRLELLKEAVPMLSRVAVLWSPAESGNARNFKETEIAAQSLSLKLLSLGLRSADDLNMHCNLQLQTELARSSSTGYAKDATNTIPIVMAQTTDPVGTGIVASLARPGGNITGLSNLAPELSGKRLAFEGDRF